MILLKIYDCLTIIRHFWILLAYSHWLETYDSHNVVEYVNRKTLIMKHI